MCSTSTVLPLRLGECAGPRDHQGSAGVADGTKGRAMNDTLIPSGPARGQLGPSATGGRLLRRTFGIALLLVSGGLITSGVVELLFRYRESVESIGTLQREMAQGAAFKIRQFIQDIEKTMRASTQTQEIVVTGLTEAYRFDLTMLLKTAPAITEVAALNSAGHERIKMSRVRVIPPEELKDRSTDLAFLRARTGAPFFGPVYFVRQSEPYMRIAVPIEPLDGDVIGVLVAKVNLKYIWEVVSRVKVGRTGYAYVVSREGDLIAHPNITLVLQKRNLKDLSQVKAALAGMPLALAPQPNLAGKKVFPTYAPIPDLGWVVLVERPAGESYALLYGSLLRTAALLLLGLGIAVVASLLISRRVLRPVEVLRRGAARIGAGALDHRIDVRTGDELEALGEEFNRMAARLQESYTSLEQKVDQRTHELSGLNQKLDEASRHKSQFLANVNHELRTPVSAIIGFTRLVLRKTEGQIHEAEREKLQKTLITGEHLLNMINGLLDLAKIEAGRVEVRLETVKVDEVIRWAASTVEPILKDGRVRLIREIASGIPSLNTDREKLEQIILNLLSNAAKFTEKGEIKISASQENGSLKLVVSDTGIGIEKRALNHVFEEFHRADTLSTRKHGGTGLGLAIVKKLVNVMGGDICVESEVGKGSTFTVTLPLEHMNTTPAKANGQSA